MTLLTRALLAILALPGTVAVVVPALLARAGTGPTEVWSGGLVLVALGALLLGWCARMFHTAGHGTLAP